MKNFTGNQRLPDGYEKFDNFTIEQLKYGLDEPDIQNRIGYLKIDMLKKVHEVLVEEFPDSETEESTEEQSEQEEKTEEPTEDEEPSEETDNEEAPNGPKRQKTGKEIVNEFEVPRKPMKIEGVNFSAIAEAARMRLSDGTKDILIKNGLTHP